MITSIFDIKDLRDFIAFGLYFLFIWSVAFTAIQANNGKINKRNIHKFVITIVILFMVACFFNIANNKRHDYIESYEKVNEYIENKNYAKAYFEILQIPSGWRDRDNLYEYVYVRYQYDEGMLDLNLDAYESAYKHFKEAGLYLDADVLADYCYFHYLHEQYPDWDASIKERR